jgi:hypothetical protein
MLSLGKLSELLFFLYELSNVGFILKILDHFEKLMLLDCDRDLLVLREPVSEGTYVVRCVSWGACGLDAGDKFDIVDHW